MATESNRALEPINDGGLRLTAQRFTRSDRGATDELSGEHRLRLATPSLPDVVANPTLVERLPRSMAIEYQRVVRRLDADLGARIAMGTDSVDAPRTADEADRAVGLDEAAHILGIEKRTLERKPTWQRLAGYKDVDGRVKFRLAGLRRHIARRSTNGGRA